MGSIGPSSSSAIRKELRSGSLAPHSAHRTPRVVRASRRADDPRRPVRGVRGQRPGPELFPDGGGGGRSDRAHDRLREGARIEDLAMKHPKDDAKMVDVALARIVIREGSEQQFIFL